MTDLLVTRGARPRALIHPSDEADGLTDSEVSVCHGDLCDLSVIGPAMAGVDCVIHCAARTGPWGSASEYERTNVRGLETLVRAAMAANVRRFVHVSSITVHGNDVHGEADEDSPMQNEPNPYSRSKVAGEKLLGRMIRDEGAPVTIVRPGWIYGPRDTASFARIARMIDQRRMIMIGSGENHLPLIYARDAAEGVLLASKAGQAEGRSYVLVNDEPVTQRDFITAIAAELGASVPARRIPYGLAVMLGALSENAWRVTRRRQPPPVMRYGLQLLGGENRFVISRARHELGFSPTTGLAEGVRNSVAWFREAHRAPERVTAPA